MQADIELDRRGYKEPRPEYITMQPLYHGHWCKCQANYFLKNSESMWPIWLKRLISMRLAVQFSDPLLLCPLVCSYSINKTAARTTSKLAT